MEDEVDARLFRESASVTRRQRLTYSQIRDLENRTLDAIRQGHDIRALETLLERAHFEKDLDANEPYDPADADVALDQFAGDRYEEALNRLAEAPVIAGYQNAESAPLIDSYVAARPAAAATSGGKWMVTWLEWSEDQGEIVRAAYRRGRDGPPILSASLSGQPGDCFRPTCVFDNGGNPWVFYAKRSDNHVSVWACHFDGTNWTQPERVSGETTPSFNQEVVASSDGVLECLWQAPISGTFAILTSRREGGAWSEPIAVSSTGSSAWDPSITALPAGGAAYAWSEYHLNSFRICIRLRVGAEFEPIRPITSGTDYALHPSLAAASDGSVWCAFDRTTIQGHGGSGPTQLRPTAELDTPFRARGVPEGWTHMERTDTKATIEVVNVTLDGIRVPAGELAPGLVVRPAAFPKLAVTRDDGLVVAYRILRSVPLQDPYWETAVQILGPRGWSGPTLFDHSRAGPEEVAVASADEGVLVTWQLDKQPEDRARFEADPWRPAYLADQWVHEGDMIDPTPSTVGLGSLRLGWVTSHGPADMGALDDLSPSVNRVDARRWPGRGIGRYAASTSGARYQLYWGDFHRHSLVSRCLSGEEPTLEDYDRYSRDICEYDFWALTDHAEHTSPYHWWAIKKRADLLRVDGHFVPLYGFEWTSTYGHQNVIYADVNRQAPIFSAADPETHRPDQLWTALRDSGYRAVTIPHHPGSRRMATDWSYYDPEFLRLTEIFQSCRGNYEAKDGFRRWGDASANGSFVMDALAAGLRFGLVASSDHGYGAAFVGAYSAGLDRDQIFEAIHSRRTIAATSRDIVLDMRAAGAFIGEAVRHDGPVEVEVHAEAYAEIARLELMRDGRVIQSIVGGPDLSPGDLCVPVHLEWDESIGIIEWSGGLTIEEGRVLETPYWSPAITETGPRGVTWSARTARGHRGGIDLTLIGTPQSAVHVVAGAHVLTTTLRELVADRPATVSRRGAGRLTLSKGFGGLVGIGDTQSSIQCVDAPEGSSWYMSRVILVDGEMAWSSPIWIDR